MQADKSSSKPETEGKVIMSIALEMKRSIVVLGGSRGACDTRESMIARAARKAGISFRQAKSFFYGETTDPRSSVVEKVRAAMKAEHTDVLAARLSALEATLDHVDPEFFGPAIAALRDATRAVSREANASVPLAGSMAGEAAGRGEG